MDSDLNNLIRLNKADIRAAQTLARAFHDYPISVYFEPDENRRRETAPTVYRFLLRHGLKFGEVYATSPQYEGVAVWFPADSWHDAWWANFISGRAFIPLVVGNWSTRKQMAFGRYAGEVQRRVAPFPHWYLQILGVDPRYQGQGFASRLLKPMLDRIDREGLPCFLETQSERNVALYEHLGFRVMEQGTIPGSDIKSWAMLRGQEKY